MDTDLRIIQTGFLANQKTVFLVSCSHKIISIFKEKGYKIIIVIEDKFMQQEIIPVPAVVGTIRKNRNDEKIIRINQNV